MQSLNIGSTAEIGADEPLHSAEKDRYELAPVAYHLARVIAGLKGSGQVVAVNAPWGGGKTSVVNLTKCLFERPDGSWLGDVHADDRYRPKRCPKDVFKSDTEGWRNSKTVFVEFNAWLHSGTEGIVFSIFDTISDTLDNPTTAMKIGRKMFRHLKRNPGQAVQGAIGLVNLTNLLTADNKGDHQTEATFELNNLASKLESEVKTLKDKIEDKSHRLVIVVDDIDRMPPDRIQSLIVALWWVRELPKVSFLLLYDSRQVIDSLSRTMFHSSGEAEAKESAARFLEKIVQYSFDVPQPTRDQLVTALEESLKDNEVCSRFAPSAAGKIPGLPGDLFMNDQRWRAIEKFVLRGLVNTPRAVKRLMLAVEISWTMRAYVKIDPRDLVALEAIRLFRPELFSEIEAFSAQIERGDVVVKKWNHESDNDVMMAVLMPAHFHDSDKVPLESQDSVKARRGFGDPELMSHYLQGVPYRGVATLYDVEDFFHQGRSEFVKTLIQAADEDKLKSLVMHISSKISNGQANGRTHKELAEQLREAANKAPSEALKSMLRKEADLIDPYVDA